MKHLLPKFLFSFFLIPTAFASVYIGETQMHNKSEEQASFVGLTSLNNSSFQNITVVGPLSFNNLEVKNDAELVGKTENSQNGKFKNLFITGSFNAHNVQCSQLKAVGLVEVSHLEVREKTEISGYISIQKGHLQDVEVIGMKMQLEDVEVNNLLIKEDLIDPEAQQVLVLAGHTIVKGDIIFKSGKGIIQLSSSAKIIGNTTGAAIQKLQHKPVNKGEL